ncbi:hypothetical protein Cgig2_011411 [Carnegiea gigantea]|uniref:Uncharacterized protein n=1 Tax=Carnegiea gigantea TaxID=171969 RepID=A0A9Q1KS17_9CARY|nr:hypothetical protein Cgig2_011411 [Carnegiea gigantea]
MAGYCSFSSIKSEKEKPQKQLQKPTPNMHRWDRHNQARVKHKQAQYDLNSQTPAFSSSFLDRINESLKTHQPKTEHQSDELMLPRSRGRPFEEDKMPTLRTAFSSEKWAEKKVQDKVIARWRNPSFSTPSSPSTNRLDELDLQDTLFFSTTKTDYPVFHPPKSALPPRPKLDLDPHDKEAIFVKTRSRAHKIYSNLKYLKQPISPGARLTSLISALFVKEGKTKKTTTAAVNSTVDGGGGGGEGRRECKSEQAPTTPSTRSCLSRNSSKKKKFEDGVKRTVRFCPVGVIVGEDSRPCGHKSLFGDDEDYYYDFEEEKKKKLERENERAKLQQAKQRQLEEMALDLLNGYWDSKLSSKSHNQKVNDKINHVDYGVNHGKNYNHDDDDDDDDGVSCSSSDLFELDHLSSVGDELPVYETTHFDSKIM